ncbi:transposase [Streptomyces filipinensis]|uniref:transposase n=1 Tax=Streptomyces filipinensis TaxID=66887 RepID=UPI0036E067F1
MPVVSPSAKALRDLRRRLGAAPVRSLELMTLVETGTRALIGAVFGPTDEGEAAYALRLLHLLRPDMLVLWDKGFDANGFLAQVTATGAKVLGRLRSNRRTPVLVRLDDGSYLSVIGTVNVRIIDAEITVTCSDGTVFTGSYRLVTTLTDARRHSARALVNLYHERWEHESTYFALRHTILAGRNLRSGDRVGLEQEMWALLTLYQALRAVMVEAAESVPGTDPDRCCFTIALQTARDQLIQAAGILPDEPDSLGLIGRRVLARLLAHRRHRTSTRKVKSPMSRYSERRDDGRPDRSRSITDLTVSVLEPGAEQPPLPTASCDDRYTAPAQRRRHRILALLQDDPTRLWRPAEIAAHFGDITLHTMYRQLSRWAGTGLIHKLEPGLTAPEPVRFRQSHMGWSVWTGVWRSRSVPRAASMDDPVR